MFILFYGAVLSPWILRNSLLYHKPSFLTDSGGLTFYLGNNPTVKLRLYGGEWRRGQDTDYPVNEPDRTPETAIETGHRFTLKAIDFIKSNPVFFIKNSMIKAVRVWYPFYSDAPVWSRWLAGIQFFAVLLLGLMGMFVRAADWRKQTAVYLLFLYVTAVHALTVPSIRYRYALMPFLMMFAAVTLDKIRLYGCKKSCKIEPASQLLP